MTIEVRLMPLAKRSKSATSAKGEKPKTTGRPKSAHAAPSNVDPRDGQHTARVTKHDRVLTLLSQRNGATIREMMDVAGWQQHSVRGFLAGTVKKRLGFKLTSSKADGELRRYRIDTKRGR